MNTSRAALLSMVGAALVALTVAGCGMFERKVEYVPYEVQVEVPVPCSADRVPEPDWGFTGKRLPRATVDNFDIHLDAMAAELHQRVGYEEKLKAAVDGCR